MSDIAAEASVAPDSDHDHSGCREKAIRTAERVCADRGAKLTPIRREILEMIWASHKAVKAYDLLDQLKPVDRTAKPTTVYRALDFLLEQGLIHRVESLNAFVGCSCSERKHEQLLLICSACEQVEERPAPKVMTALDQEMAEAGFIIHRKAIEVHGICARCAASG